MTDSATDALFLLISGTIILLMMALFSVSFILYYHRRQRASLREKQALQEAYQREILQAQLETQNQTLEYVGRELHDNVGQLLSVAMLQLNGLEEDLAHSTHHPAVGAMVQTIVQTIQEVRQLAKTLDSGTVRRFGLRDSLGFELERIGHTKRYQAHLSVSGNPYKLGDETEIILFRMAQEALNNTIKHARAKTLTVTTDYQPEDFTLIIVDDGRGFDLAEATSRQVSTSGSGVNNLYQRTKLLGGTCTIDTKPELGTRIEIKLPRQVN